MKKHTRIILSVATAITVLVLHKQVTFAETPTPTPSTTTTVTPTPTVDNSQQINDLNTRIRELESKVSDLQSEEKSLSSQISVMDNQIKLTQYRIDYTRQQIQELSQDIDTATDKISHLEGSLTDITKTLLGRISATYQLATIQPLQLLLSSQNFTDFITKTNYIRIVQANDKKLLYNTVQAKNDYANQKEIFEDKKQQVLALQTQLESYTQQLDQDKANKQRLLSETQGNEATYQRLLSQARAQLAGFSRFTESQGGASILGNQTVCDDWGCYYNQRDGQWGGNALNGTQYTLASDGCLVTSMAMVYTHYGHRGVTPATINSNSGNFASYYPAYLKFVISADGATYSRVSISRSEMDSQLAAGHPVVVGISYDGGPVSDHFVVIVSGSNGDYLMNDPFTPNGHKIPFTSKYSIGSINDIYKVNI